MCKIKAIFIHKESVKLLAPTWLAIESNLDFDKDLYVKKSLNKMPLYKKKLEENL